MKMSNEKINLLFGAFTKMKLIGALGTNPTFDFRTTDEKLDTQLTNPRKIDDGELDYYSDGDLDDDNDYLYSNTSWLKKTHDEKKTVLDKEMKEYWEHKKTPMEMKSPIVIYVLSVLSILALKYTFAFYCMIVSWAK